MTDLTATSTLLILNCGSSTLRLALYATDAQSTAPQNVILRAKVERIGMRGTQMLVSDATGQIDQRQIHAQSFADIIEQVLNWLAAQPVFANIQAVGHRIVHGMAHSRAQWITPALLADLQRHVLVDPQHLPQTLALINAIQKRHPHLPQVACFDTAFHAQMPTVAKLLPIPRRYFEQGVQRYGFHGLSYEFLLSELLRLGDPAAQKGRVILAHLGNGASMAAVRDGKGIDTSMSFTPASGLMMSTRAGDLDPGIIAYLSRSEQMSVDQYDKMVHNQSGLLGISATSADIRDLLAIESTDQRAAQAIALFCYQAKKCIGAFAAALGGLDTLVFAGGIGENAPLIRERICEGLNFLGIEMHQQNNADNAPLISTDNSRVSVRVIATDEAAMMAHHVGQVFMLHGRDS
jgi:acetate kinase